MAKSINKFMRTSNEARGITGSVKIANVQSEISILDHTFGTNLERWVPLLKVNALEYSSHMNTDLRTGTRSAPQPEFKDLTYYTTVNADFISACERLGSNDDLGITCVTETTTIDNIIEVNQIFGIAQSFVNKISLEYSTLFNAAENPSQTIVKVVITGAVIQLKYKPRGQTQRQQGYLVSSLNLIHGTS